MARSRGLLRRINRAYLLQGGLIAVAAVLGVFFAKIVIEEILVNRAILQEEDFFWENYQRDPSFGLPGTKNLTGYFNPQQLPPYIKQDLPLAPGFYQYDIPQDRQVLHVSIRDGKTLYLLYYRGQVDALVLYYGLFPLLTVLMILYLALWATYRASRKTVSPVVWLAEQIHQMDLENKNLEVALEESPFTMEGEIAVLSEAIEQLGGRINEFVTRERNFTRDASHELRSPMTVVNIAVDILMAEELPSQTRLPLEKIKRAVNDMERLVEVFLVLARQDEQALEMSVQSLKSVCESVVETTMQSFPHKSAEISVSANNDVKLWASTEVLNVAIGNLVRNAILYAETGDIKIEIEGNRLAVSNAGSGMAPEQLQKMFEPFQRGVNDNASGVGIGLSIVKRLTDRFGWHISAYSNDDGTTCFELKFPNSEVLPSEA